MKRRLSALLLFRLRPNPSPRGNARLKQLLIHALSLALAMLISAAFAQQTTGTATITRVICDYGRLVINVIAIILGVVMIIVGFSQSRREGIAALLIYIVLGVGIIIAPTLADEASGGAMTAAITGSGCTIR